MILYQATATGMPYRTIPDRALEHLKIEQSKGGFDLEPDSEPQKGDDKNKPLSEDEIPPVGTGEPDPPARRILKNRKIIMAQKGSGWVLGHEDLHRSTLCVDASRFSGVAGENSFGSNLARTRWIGPQAEVWNSVSGIQTSL
jgi:hypothetical protein